MTSLPNRRPRNPVMPASIHRGVILNLFLENYQNDPTFTKEFHNLARAHVVGRSNLGLDEPIMTAPDDWSTLVRTAQLSDSDAVEEFVAELEQFGRRWGLAYFPDDPDDEGFNDGFNALVTAIRYWRDDPEQRPFLQRSMLQSIPQVDGEVRQEGRRHHQHIQFEGTWNPFQQTPGEAIRRLEKEFGIWVRQTVHEGHQRYLRAGYEVPHVSLRDKKSPKDTAQETDQGEAQETERHLRWLYLHVAYGTSWGIIGSDEWSSGEYVRKRASRYQQLLGIRLPRTGPRNR